MTHHFVTIGACAKAGIFEATFAKCHEEQHVAVSCAGTPVSCSVQVKKTGIFTIPGLCRIKTRVKPATKAGTKVMFGKEVKVKARPAKTVVKAFPVAALKAQI